MLLLCLSKLIYFCYLPDSIETEQETVVKYCEANTWYYAIKTKQKFYINFGSPDTTDGEYGNAMKYCEPNTLYVKYTVTL